ncbi:hypothetical protein V494_00859 [Pseudogymnoascus sp. VKM F-4513 (FW-928)]|nr:hypothetical protein V494_00859 [Pseudogymnoascus sp. VKM F-4513 (FW-928)]
MTSPKPSSSFPLLTLPFEIQTAILTHLQSFDPYALRLTNRHYYALIPPPTHAELLSAETSETGFLACVGCTRLRPIAAFSSKMIMKKRGPGGAQAHNRFCIECGRRPIPGPHRYVLGSRWKENGASFVRCLRCGVIGRAPEDQRVPLCFSCHTQHLEREKAARELERVRRETREREEREVLRAARRVIWVERGGALSDFSSADPREEEDSEEDPYDWGQDDDISYTGHS